MTRLLTLFAFVVSSLLPFASAAHAQGENNSPVGGALRIGTLGVGGEVTVRLHDTLNVRGTYNALSIETDDEVDDVDYELDVDFRNPGILLDLHPFGGDFRITGGLFFTDGDVELSAVPSESETIGDVVYTPAQIGTLEGTVTFEDQAFYVGIGFGNAVARDRRVTFAFDLGVMVQEYTIDLNARGGLLESNAAFQTELAKEEAKAQDEVDDVEIYPVISLGIGIHF